MTNCLVGFSGGIDSAVLLHWMHHNLNLDILAVHIDHQIHPESGKWSEFCRQFCDDLGVRFVSRKVEFDRTRNIEANAREARYAEFATFGITDVFTAHHADDQVETLLMKLIRGSGITGLASIRSSRNINGMIIRRPLLECPKKWILQYAEKHSIPCVVDPSNASEEYTRNRIRMNVIPVLKENFPNSLKAIRRSANAFQDAAECLDDLGRIDFQNVSDGTRMSIPKMRDLSPSRLRNLILYVFRQMECSVSVDELIGFSNDLFKVTWDSKLEIQGRSANGRFWLKQKGKFITIGS